MGSAWMVGQGSVVLLAYTPSLRVAVGTHAAPKGGNALSGFADSTVLPSHAWPYGTDQAWAEMAALEGKSRSPQCCPLLVLSWPGALGAYQTMRSSTPISLVNIVLASGGRQGSCGMGFQSFSWQRCWCACAPSSAPASQCMGRSSNPPTFL